MPDERQIRSAVSLEVPDCRRIHSSCLILPDGRRRIGTIGDLHASTASNLSNVACAADCQLDLLRR